MDTQRSRIPPDAVRQCCVVYQDLIHERERDSRFVKGTAGHKRCRHSASGHTTLCAHNGPAAAAEAAAVLCVHCYRNAGPRSAGLAVSSLFSDFFFSYFYPSAAQQLHSGHGLICTCQSQRRTGFANTTQLDGDSRRTLEKKKKQQTNKQIHLMSL